MADPARCPDCRLPVRPVVHGNRLEHFFCEACKREIAPEKARAAAKAFEPWCDAEAKRLVHEALEHIQQAQAHLGRAAAALSNLEGGAGVWKFVGGLYDRVHAGWYRVEAFRQAARFKLDGVAADALAKRLREDQPSKDA